MSDEMVYDDFDEMVLDGYGQVVDTVSTAYTVSIIMSIVLPVVCTIGTIGLVIWCMKTGRCCGQRRNPSNKCCPCGGGGEEAGVEGEEPILVGSVHEPVTLNGRQNVIMVDNFFNHT